MLDASVFRNPFPILRKSKPAPKAPSARIVRKLNPETAAKLRLYLSDDFGTATSWQDLANKLLSKGFYLRFLDTDILVHDCHSHVRICSSQLLGYSSQQLESRFSATHH